MEKILPTWSHCSLSLFPPLFYSRTGEKKSISFQFLLLQDSLGPRGGTIFFGLRSVYGFILLGLAFWGLKNYLNKLKSNRP
jgi:hypothetical protein